jgi:hypothetical protein
VALRTERHLPDCLEDGHPVAMDAREALDLPHQDPDVVVLSELA